MIVENSIGAKLTHIENTVIEFQKDGQIFHFDFETEQGDCCGYADVKTELLISEKEIEKNPVITKIEKIDNSDNEDFRCCEDVKITLFGEYKPIAEIIATAGSGSGWHYGAAVTIRCRENKIGEFLATW